MLALAREALLRDGRVIRLRMATWEDRERMQAFYGRLSPTSRNQRFHGGRKAPRANELPVSSAPGGERVAQVALLAGPAGERIIGIGEWERTGSGDGAEITIAVDDQFQSRGIGTLLLEGLVDAALGAGIRRFSALVQAQNGVMLELFRQSGLHVLAERLDEGERLTLDLEDLAEFTHRREAREHTASVAGVRRVLTPRHVAVVGASRDPRSVGGAVLRNIVTGRFPGAVYPVNPRAESLEGLSCYPTLKEIPGDVDLVVVAVPSEGALDVAEQAGRKGASGLVVLSAGFAESGVAGRERERALREKSIEYGMRLVGPNCLGILNNAAGACLNATFAPAIPAPGNVAIAAESGAVGLALLNHTTSVRLGAAAFVSLGNRVDISSNDLLELWEDDPQVQVIALYLESLGNPRKFSQIARRVSRHKPIVAVKAGRSPAGVRAASSHTGALATSDVAVEALFAECGVLRVDTIEELLDTTTLLAQQPLPRGNRLGIVTNAGGLGVMAADAAAGSGLSVPDFTSALQGRLRAVLPAHAAVANPVDAIASVGPEQYEEVLTRVLASDEVDAALALYIPPLVSEPEQMWSAVQRAQAGVADGKPLLASFVMAGQERKLPQGAAGTRTPLYPFPEEAVRALARVAGHAAYRRRDPGRLPERIPGAAQRARQLLQGLQGWLLPDQAQALLEVYGIPVVPTLPAKSAEEACAQAERLGYPVAMKIRSRQIVHKSDVGGVALGLNNAAAVRFAFRQMQDRAAERSLQTEGVVLQSMMRGGQEMLVGVTHDPAFGPLLMLATGGTLVELFKDVAVALHPVTDADVERLLGRLKGSALLQGWRGSAPKDLAAFTEAVLRLSLLVQDLSQIAEVEINPLLVLDTGRGCFSLDARVRLG